ncbi:hypothetical protein G2W53_037232 [Senna tora]|uniref:Uncharacterized protein n=1 Tax=Senna tora TaxID=362788 RepID=A0A834SV04_9FABA|nr:hypothetical protein G2W53_037232 [Senna tora]
MRRTKPRSAVDDKVWSAVDGGTTDDEFRWWVAALPWRQLPRIALLSCSIAAADLTSKNMGETKDEGYEEELLDYEEEEEKGPNSVVTKVNGETAKKYIFVVSGNPDPDVCLELSYPLFVYYGLLDGKIAQ